MHCGKGRERERRRKDTQEEEKRERERKPATVIIARFSPCRGDRHRRTHRAREFRMFTARAICERDKPPPRATRPCNKPEKTYSLFLLSPFFVAGKTLHLVVESLIRGRELATMPDPLSRRRQFMSSARDYLKGTGTASHCRALFVCST